jgi:hypothetical protein
MYMIVIDGQQTNMNMNNFDNLEELLVGVMNDHYLENRVVTDVLVNQESFSEIYPHQAEDMDMEEVNRVEIKTVQSSQMGVNIANELSKVIELMKEGGRRVADLFRQAEDAEALETYQDLLDVTRDFLGMISLMREEFDLREQKSFNQAMEELSDLVSELLEVQENEDWILLADLVEYEFLPVVDKWKKVVVQLQEGVQSVHKKENNNGK